MKIKPFKIEKIIDNECVVFYPTLIQIQNKNYLVDCGYQETVPELLLELSKLGVEIADLTGVVITHDDHDHLGGLSALKKMNANLKVFCGKEEAESVAGKVKSERLIQAENLLSQTPAEYRDYALGFIERLKNVERVVVDKTLEDNELLDDELLVVHTPGHTKGHISLYCIEEKTLIAGDAVVLENGEFCIANPSYTLDMKQALQSVEKIKALAPKKIICYHGGVLKNCIEESFNHILNNK